MSANTLSKPSFGFEFLWNFTQTLFTNNSSSSDLTYPYTNSSVATLTYGGCVSAVGGGAAPYSRQDVYDRVLLWRVPLIALWATATLPALGLHTKSLLYKLDLAKRTTEWAKNQDKGGRFSTLPSESTITQDIRGGPPAREQAITEGQHDGETIRLLQKNDPEIKEYFQDVIALIISAYDEWGYRDASSKAMVYSFNQSHWPLQRAAMRKRCASAAFYIASDRVSRFLPSAISTLVFFVQIFAGFWKTLDSLSETYDESNPVSQGLNRAPHNIAFGVLFFWLPFAVLMTAFVGGSQTSHLVPRVLESFRRDVNKLHQSKEGSTAGLVATEVANATEPDSEHPSDTTRPCHSECIAFPNISSEVKERWSRGGLPVWQPAKFQDMKNRRLFWLFGPGLSFVIVAIPAGCAMSLSWLTPTEGFGCRSMTQLSFLISWVVSAAVDWGLCLSLSASDSSVSAQNVGTMEKIYYLAFFKDFILMAGTVGVLTESALGMFNKCLCWSKWFPLQSTGYISFPQEQYIFDLIKSQLSTTFPIIVSCALGGQIVIFAIIAAYFRDGYRVLKQRNVDEVPAKADAEASPRGSGESVFGRLFKFRHPRRINTLDDMSVQHPSTLKAHENADGN